MADETPVAEETKEEEKVQEIKVPADIAFQLKLQEFDLNIATAEAQVYDLKKQRAEFTYNSNVQTISAQAKAQAEAPVDAPAEEK